MMMAVMICIAARINLVWNPVSGRLKGPPKETSKAVRLTDRKEGITLFGANFVKNANKIMASIEGMMVATTTSKTGMGSLTGEYSEIGMIKFSPNACARLKISRLTAVAVQVIKKPEKSKPEGDLTFIQVKTGLRSHDL